MFRSRIEGRSERNELLAKLKYIRGILAIKPEGDTRVGLKPISGIGKTIEKLRERINSLPA